MSSFACWHDFLFFRSYWFVLRVALYLLPSSLFATTIRSDCTTRTKKEQAYRLRLEHFCDSHIQASVGATLRSTRLWRSLNRIFVKSKTSRNRNVKSQSSREIRNTTVPSQFSTFLKIIKSEEQNFFTVNSFNPIYGQWLKYFNFYGYRLNFGPFYAYRLTPLRPSFRGAEIWDHRSFTTDGTYLIIGN